MNQHKEKVVNYLAATRKEAQNLNQTQEKCLHAVSMFLKTENSVPPQMCICYAYFAKMCHGV